MSLSAFTAAHKVSGLGFGSGDLFGFIQGRALRLHRGIQLWGLIRNVSGVWGGVLGVTAVLGRPGELLPWRYTVVDHRPVP